MAETSGFFDAEELVGGGYDREYVAEQWANYFKLFISNGVFVTPTNQLKVVSNSGMTVTVMAGWAWINGYWYNNGANLNLTIPANTSAATKKHGIFVQFDAGERTIKLVVGNERTTVNRTSPYYELKLAEITVAPGVSAITTADITDTRGNSSVCGFVTGVVDVIDTGDLFAQFTAIFNNFLTASQTSRIQDEAAFETWFNAMKGQLTTDAAGHLQTEIDDLEEALTGEVVDSEPYVLRQGLGNLADMELVGGSLAWNQLIQNGNFSDGTNGWSSNGTITVSNNVLTFKASNRFGNVSRNIANKPNHKLLMFTTAKAYVNSLAYIQLRLFSSLSPSTYTDEAIQIPVTKTTLAKIINVPSNIVQTSYMIQDNSYSSWDNIEVSNVQIIDLTALFGSSTIADYIYSLEQATAGAGVAWFRKYFPNAYYGYQSGKIESVNVKSRKAVGFNQWDEQLEIGMYDTDTGEKTSTTATLRNVNKIDVFPDTVYYCCSNILIRYLEYDANGKYLGTNTTTNTTFRTQKDTAYLNIQCGLDYKYICINISKTEGSPKNGDYVPYSGTEYPFANKQLRGIPKLVDNKLSYDGDIYTADGTVTRKYTLSHLGDLNWEYDSTNAFFKTVFPATMKINSILFCNAYVYGGTRNDGNMGTAPRGIYNANTTIKIKDTNYTDAATFKTAMNGVYLISELATPTTESANAYQNPQRAFIDGTEEFVDYGVYHNDRDVAIPVGIDARYYLSEVLPAAEDYTDGAAERINANISLIQSDILGIISNLNALNEMYDGKAPSITNNLNTLLAVGGKKFSVYGFNPSTTNAPTTASGLVFTWSFDSYNGAQLVIAEDNVYYRKNNGGSMDSWQTIDFVTNLESTKTLSTTTSTIYTFSSSMITANSAIDVYTNIFGVVPSNVSVSSGSCTVTFPPYTSATSMKCRIAVRR